MKSEGQLYTVTGLKRMMLGIMPMSSGKTDESTQTSETPILGVVKTIEDLVKNGAELPEFEFKSKINIDKSRDYQRCEFLKDLMAVANSSFGKKQHMVIGVDIAGKRFCGLHDSSGLDDDANLGQFVTSYISPPIAFRFYKAQVSGDKEIGIFEFDEIQNSPHAFSKSYQGKDNGKDKIFAYEGECYVRARGTGNSTGKKRADRSDFDRFYEGKIENKVEQRLALRMKFIESEKKAEEPAKKEIERPTFDLNFLSFSRDEWWGLLKQSESLARQTYLQILIGSFIDAAIKAWRETRSFRAEEPDRNKATAIRDSIIRPVLRKLVEAIWFYAHFEINSPVIVAIFKGFRDLMDLANEKDLGLRGYQEKEGEPLGVELPAYETIIALYAAGTVIVKLKQWPMLRSLFEIKCIRQLDSGAIYSAPLAYSMMVYRPRFPKSNLLPGYWLAFKAIDLYELTELTGSDEQRVESFCSFDFILELNSFIPQIKLNKAIWEYRPFLFYFEVYRVGPFVLELLEDPTVIQKLIFYPYKVNDPEALLRDFLDYLDHSDKRGYDVFGHWSRDLDYPQIKKFLERVDRASPPQIPTRSR